MLAAAARNCLFIFCKTVAQLAHLTLNKLVLAPKKTPARMKPRDGGCSKMLELGWRAGAAKRGTTEAAAVAEMQERGGGALLLQFVAALRNVSGRARGRQRVHQLSGATCATMLHLYDGATECRGGGA